MHISKTVYSSHLFFVWDVNNACPGHFLEIFRPLEGVSFVSNSSYDSLANYSKAAFASTRSTFEYIMMEFDVPKNRFGFMTWWDIQMINYALLRPTANIQKKANDYIILHNICNTSAMHLRQTDMHSILPPKKRASIESFDRFISNRNDDEKLFLMTDNPDAQKRFLDK